MIYDTVESCLLLLSHVAELKQHDKKLISSLSRQIENEVGLTDRQLRLARKKLDEYRKELEPYTVDVDLAKQHTQLDIRYIDRSRWISLEQSEEGVSILVRFAYQKNLIRRMEKLLQLIPQESRTYDPVTKTHRLDYSESNLYEIVKTFSECEFDIDVEVMTLYQELCNLDPKTVVPGVYNKQLKNLPAAGQQLIEQELGGIDDYSLALYRDRSIRYGLHYFESKELWRSLSRYSYLAQKIATRSLPNLVLEDSTFPIENILLALEELKRLPVLVVIPSQTPEAVVEIHKRIRNIIPRQDVSVMFRLNNDKAGAYFNSWIKEQGLNNSIDKHKKILYTLDNRIPKPILLSEWQPRSVISLAQNTLLVSARKILNFYADQDLIVHLENANGNVIERGYFNMERIE